MPCLGETELRHKYENLLSEGNANPQRIHECIEQIRELILIEGLPAETEREKEIMKGSRATVGETGTLRGRIWKALLRIDVVDVNYYLDLVERGPDDSKIYEKITLDTPRTFKNDTEFNARVSQNALKRVLNSFLMSYGGDGSDFSFLQGMSIISGVFLYVMNEVDAFYAFKRFITRVCPTYFRVNEMVGVYSGVELIDEIIEHVDPPLRKIIPEGRQWGFEFICTFLTNQQPLSEALKFFDFFIAFGFHYSIIFAATQAIMIRDKLLELKNEKGALQKTLIGLNTNLVARQVINVGCQIICQIPEATYHRVVRNLFDFEVARAVVVEANEKRKMALQKKDISEEEAKRKRSSSVPPKDGKPSYLTDTKNSLPSIRMRSASTVHRLFNKVN